MFIVTIGVKELINFYTCPVLYIGESCLDGFHFFSIFIKLPKTETGRCNIESFCIPSLNAGSMYFMSNRMLTAVQC